MNITVVTRLGADHTRLKHAVINRLERSLERYSRHVARANVTLVDENGPRGGVDKRCQVSVAVHGAPEVTASARHENPWIAFTQAAERVQQIISRKFSRMRTRRVQGHRRATSPENLEADVASPALEPVEPAAMSSVR